MNNTNLIAIDLAKNVFQVWIMDKHNKILLNKAFNRKALTEFMVQQPPGLVQWRPAIQVITGADF